MTNQVVLAGAKKAAPMVISAAAAAFTASEVAGLMVVGTVCALPIMAGIAGLMWMRHKTNSTARLKVNQDGVDFRIGGA